MSRVWPLWAGGWRLIGKRTLTGSDKSYRRAVRRSVIPTAPPRQDKSTTRPRVLELQSFFQRTELLDPLRRVLPTTDCPKQSRLTDDLKGDCNPFEHSNH